MDSKALVTVALVFGNAVLTVEAATPNFYLLNIHGSIYCQSKENSYSYSEAKIHCLDIGAELAFFDDNAEYQQVFQAMSRNSTTARETWIYFNYTYLNGVYSFYWRNESFDSYVWQSGDPNENCKTGKGVCCARLRLSPAEGLADRDCATAIAFLCKARPQCSSDDSNCSITCGNQIQPLQCLTGFVLDTTNQACKDVDECKTSVSHCHQKCVNSYGSYTCGCDTGYTLNTDNQTCDDIDECSLGDMQCQQNCTNTVGAFRCSCFDGFTLQDDNRTCADINECLYIHFPCQQICNNTNGSYACSCENGYTLSENGYECIRMEECLVSRCERQCQNTSTSKSCMLDCQLTSELCQHNCVRQNGTYECTCRPGYSLNTTDETACHDTDECSLNNSLCEVYCNNIPGSYYCSCAQGYHLSENKYACEKSTLHNYCPCSCSFSAKNLLMSKEQMTTYLKALTKSLQVVKSNLLATRLLAESQLDERPSSSAIGYAGLVFVCIVFGALILPDCVTLICAILNKIKSHDHNSQI